jgi:hypothetical protein
LHVPHPVHLWLSTTILTIPFPLYVRFSVKILR